MQRKRRKGHSHVPKYTQNTNAHAQVSVVCINFFASHTQTPFSSGLIKRVRFTSVFGHLFRSDSFTRQLLSSFVCGKIIIFLQIFHRNRRFLHTNKMCETITYQLRRNICKRALENQSRNAYQMFKGKTT